MIQEWSWLGGWTVESELRHSFTPHHTQDVRTNHVTGTDYDLKKHPPPKIFFLKIPLRLRVECQVKCYFVKWVIRPLIHSSAPNPEWHLQQRWVVIQWSQRQNNHSFYYLICDPHSPSLSLCVSETGHHLMHFLWPEALFDLTQGQRHIWCKWKWSWKKWFDLEI